MIGASNTNNIATTNFSYFAVAGTLKNLNIVLNGTPGAGKSYNFTVYNSSTPTSLTCTVSDTNTTCSDIVNTVTVAAGDELKIVITPSGTPTARTFLPSMTFSANALKTTPQWVMSTLGSSTRYAPIQGIGGNTTENISRSNFTSPGTYKNFRMRTLDAPGAGTSHVFTVYKNSSPTSLTCTISDTNTSCSDTSNTVSVTDGDILTIQGAIVGSPAATTGIGGGEFDPSIEGDFPLLSSGNGIDYSSLATGYNVVQGPDTRNTIETFSYENANPMNITKFYFRLTIAPGSGKSWVATLKKNGADTAINCTISGTDTLCNSVGNIAYAQNDTLSTQITPVGTPPFTKVSTGYNGHIAAASSGTVIDLYNSTIINTTVQ